MASYKHIRLQWNELVKHFALIHADIIFPQKNCMFFMSSNWHYALWLHGICRLTIFGYYEMHYFMMSIFLLILVEYNPHYSIDFKSALPEPVVTHFVQCYSFNGLIEPQINESKCGNMAKRVTPYEYIYMNIWTFKCKNYLNIMQYILVSYNILDAKRAFRIYIYINGKLENEALCTRQ